MTDTKQTRPRTPAAKKSTANPRVPRKQPQDHKPKLAAVPEQPALTEQDYRVDTAVILQVLGIEPGHVKAGSVHLSFPEGIPVLEYQVQRAVPAQALAVAMLRGATQNQEAQEGEAGEPSG